jgi:multidrug efflux pump subunit AcrA (membrane-fusion protein)
MVTPFSSAVDSKGAVVSMADMSTLEVEADVSESSLVKIKVGQPCEITLDALPDTRFRGRVSRMVPTVDRAKATVMTKVQFDAIDPRILPEMSAKVSFLSQEVTAGDQRPRLAVSPEALVSRGGADFLYAVRDGKAVEVRVVRGEEDRRRRRDHRRGSLGRESRAEAARGSPIGRARQGRAEVSAAAPSRRPMTNRELHAAAASAAAPGAPEPLVAIARSPNTMFAAIRSFRCSSASTSMSSRAITSR